MSIAPTPTRPPHTLRDWLRLIIGPGLLMAATGVGASDWVTSTVNGGRFGVGILWIIVAGVLIKGVMTEGLARWQLATGTTMIDGWRRVFPAWCRPALLAYVTLWSFLVSGSIGAACGMAGHALLPLPFAPQLSIAIWGSMHLVLAFFLVRYTRYQTFEAVVSGLVLLMFATAMISAVASRPDWAAVWHGLWPLQPIPAGSAPFLLAAIGGIGGSVTLLSYGYWLHEGGRVGTTWLPATRFDIIVSYGLTALFNVSVMIIAAQVLYPAPDITEQRTVVLDVATRLRSIVGPIGYGAFLFGFWGATFSTALGCLHGVPYLFSDLLRPTSDNPTPLRRSPWYHRFLWFMTFPPLLQLFLVRPVQLVIVFTMLAAAFTPLLAGTLLYLNNHPRWIGPHRNRWRSNLVLVAALVLFAYLLGTEVWAHL